MALLYIFTHIGMNTTINEGRLSDRDCKRLWKFQTKFLNGSQPAETSAAVQTVDEDILFAVNTEPVPLPHQC